MLRSGVKVCLALAFAVIATAAIVFFNCNKNPVSQSNPAWNPRMTAAGSPIVGIARDASSIENAVNTAVSLVGGLPFNPSGKTILLKPNLNSGDPIPFSTGPQVVSAVINMLKRGGAKRIVVADRSNPNYNTIDCFKKAGLYNVILNLGAEVIDLASYSFRNVNPAGQTHWGGGFGISTFLDQVDYVINLPVCKDHSAANYTMALKAWYGLVSQNDRSRGHGVSVEEMGHMLAELHLARKENFIIMDASQVCLTGGPYPGGATANTGLIVATADPVANEVTGLAILKHYLKQKGLKNSKIDNFSCWNQPQVVRARQIGLGITDSSQYSAGQSGVTEFNSLMNYIGARPVNYTLTTTAVNGSINPSGGTYTAGTIVTLTAVGGPGYGFSSWSGDLTGSSNPATITMDANKSVTANFTPVPQYTLTTSAVNGTVSPAGGTYNSGTVVTLTATAAAGYAFSSWSGDLTGTTSPATITMNSNKSVTANFGVASTPITFEAENASPSASAAGFNVSTGDANNSNSAYVQFTAAPAVGDWLQFTLANLPAATYNIRMYFKANTNRCICQGSVDGNNLGSACDEYRTAVAYQVMSEMGSTALGAGNHTIRFSVTGKSPSSTGYTMTVDKIVLTPVSTQTYTLTTSVVGSGTISPAGGTYNEGAVVSLTATPAAGFAFTGWSGALSGTANPAPVTMNGNKSVTATFTAIQQYTLTTSVVGSGTISPAGGTYNEGTVVSLTATPAAGFAFTGWSGALSGTANPASVTMNGNKSVTATFTEIPQYTLTTSVVGNGTISPAGGTYNAGTVVTLTATPAAGYTFSSWSGDLTGSANPATITMNANKGVTATFTLIPTTTTYEAENLARTASAAGSQVVTGATGASNNSYVQFANTPVVGDWLEFTINGVVAATYNIRMYFKSNNNRSMCQGSVDGTNLGGPCDEYQATATQQVVFNMGNRALAAGSHTIRFAVTGKNASSSGYTMTIDKLVLTTQ